MSVRTASHQIEERRGLRELTTILTGLTKWKSQNNLVVVMSIPLEVRELDLQDFVDS